MKLLSSIFMLVVVMASTTFAGPLDEYAKNSGGAGSVKFVGNQAKFQGLFIYACNYSASDACREEVADSLCRKFGFSSARGLSVISTYEAKLSDDAMIWEVGEQGANIVLRKTAVSSLNSPKVFSALNCAY